MCMKLFLGKRIFRKNIDIHYKTNYFLIQITNNGKKTRRGKIHNSLNLFNLNIQT